MNMIEVRNKVINMLRKVLERILNKTRKPRRYSEIKKIVKTFVETLQYLISDTLRHITAQKVQDWKIEVPVDILKEAYQLFLVSDNKLLDIVKDIDSYHEYCYKELEMRIYNKLPEYCRVMIETTSLWIEYLKKRDDEWKELLQNQQKK